MNLLPGGTAIKKISGKSLEERSELHPNEIPVKQYDLEGNFIKE